jgi:hypothetical protein
VLDTWVYKYTLKIHNSSCFSIATMNAPQYYVIRTLSVLLHKAAEHVGDIDLNCSEVCMLSVRNVTGPLEKDFARVSSILQQMSGLYANSALYCMAVSCSPSKINFKIYTPITALLTATKILYNAAI